MVNAEFTGGQYRGAMRRLPLARVWRLPSSGQPERCLLEWCRRSAARYQQARHIGRPECTTGQAIAWPGMMAVGPIEPAGGVGCCRHGVVPGGLVPPVSGTVSPGTASGGAWQGSAGPCGDAWGGLYQDA